MSLARRIRDCRYARGWGPDELASRAEISRTALYQIECGKTETPRASTLRRIAEALEVPIDALLDVTDAGWACGVPEPGTVGNMEEALADDERAGSSLEALDIVPREDSSSFGPRRSHQRQRDLDRKFHEVLASPLGDGLARIVEESHRLLPAWRERRSS